MLDILISSKTRFNLLIKFFLVQGTKSYLRMLEKEFNESTNALRVELNRMEEAKLLISENNMNRKYFMANPKHPLYDCVGDLESAYIIGNFAQGINSDTIDLALVGKNLDTDYINQLIPKAGKMINRKIKYMTLFPDQMEYFFKDKPKYLFWQADGEDKS